MDPTEPEPIAFSLAEWRRYNALPSKKHRVIYKRMRDAGASEASILSHLARLPAKPPKRRRFRFVAPLTFDEARFIRSLTRTKQIRPGIVKLLKRGGYS